MKSTQLVRRDLLAIAMFVLALNPSARAFDVIQALPSTPIIPTDNVPTNAKVELGKQLFFDVRLSKNGNKNCNSCHNLFMGGDDDGAVSTISENRLKRSAPTVWNVGHMSTYNWEARSPSLEAHAEEHLLDPRILDQDNENNIVKRLQTISGYQSQFEKAFGSGTTINIKNISKALASFERTLNTPNSPFDRYVKGDKNAISESVKRGFKLFDDTGCLSCHFGVNFAGPAPGPALNMGDGFWELFPNHLGSSYDAQYDLTSDLGRFYVTKDPRHKYMWRVPSLRNIARTAPYFHNGSVAALEEAVRIMAKTQLKTEFTPQQLSDVVEFLKSLDGDIPNIALPTLPETTGKSLIGGK